jgi:hypothetical protein
MLVRKHGLGGLRVDFMFGGWRGQVTGRSVAPLGLLGCGGRVFHGLAPVAISRRRYAAKRPGGFPIASGQARTAPTNDRGDKDHV